MEFPGAHLSQWLPQRGRIPPPSFWHPVVVGKPPQQRNPTNCVKQTLIWPSVEIHSKALGRESASSLVPSSEPRKPSAHARKCNQSGVWHLRP